MNIYEKLQSARVELQKRALKKSGYNGFSKFEYFQLQDFLPAINEIFNELKLCSVFTIDGAFATLTVINSEKTDEQQQFISPVAESGIKGATPIQNLGGVHTYMRRYMWLMAMEIVEHDAIDALPPEKKEEKPFVEENKLVSQNMIDALRSYYTTGQLETMLKRRKIEKLELLPWDIGLKWIHERPQLNVTDNTPTY